MIKMSSFGCLLKIMFPSSIFSCPHVSTLTLHIRVNCLLQGYRIPNRCAFTNIQHISGGNKLSYLVLSSVYSYPFQGVIIRDRPSLGEFEKFSWQKASRTEEEPIIYLAVSSSACLCSHQQLQLLLNSTKAWSNEMCLSVTYHLRQQNQIYGTPGTPIMQGVTSENRAICRDAQIII